MRKAATPDNFDFTLDGEGDEDRASFARRLLGAHPAARIAVAALGALSLAIVVNALALQDQRHAAPLIQMSLRSPSVPAEPQSAPPLPAPRPVELAVAPASKPLPAPRIDASRPDPIGREIARLDPSSMRADKAKPVEQKPGEAKHADAIGGLIRSVGASPASEPAAATMSAQRALMKLGFVVRPDGVFGGSTRQAIERFERDNRMPVRGELSARVKAELSRQSGLEIE